MGSAGCGLSIKDFSRFPQGSFGRVPSEQSRRTWAFSSLTRSESCARVRSRCPIKKIRMANSAVHLFVGSYMAFMDTENGS